MIRHIEMSWVTMTNNFKVCISVFEEEAGVLEDNVFDFNGLMSALKFYNVAVVLREHGGFSNIRNYLAACDSAYDNIAK